MLAVSVLLSLRCNSIADKHESWDCRSTTVKVLFLDVGKCVYLVSCLVHDMTQVSGCFMQRLKQAELC